MPLDAAGLFQLPALGGIQDGLVDLRAFVRPGRRSSVGQGTHSQPLHWQFTWIYQGNRSGYNIYIYTCIIYKILPSYITTMNIAVAQLEQAYCCSLTPLVTKNTMTYRNSYSYPVDHRSNIIQNWQQTVVCNHGSSTTTCSYFKVQKKVAVMQIKNPKSWLSLPHFSE